MKLSKCWLVALSIGVLFASCEAKKSEKEGKKGNVRGSESDFVQLDDVSEPENELDSDHLVEAKDCQTRLALCQDQTGGRSAPIAEWASMITTMFEKDKSGAVNSLNSFLVRASVVDFHNITDVVLSEDGEQEIESLFYNVTANQVPTSETKTSSASLTNILFTVEFVVNALLHIYGFKDGKSLRPITDLVSMVRRIVTSIPDGTNAVFETMMTEVITYMTNMIVFVAESSNIEKHRRRLGKIDQGDEEFQQCVPLAMECEFNNMLLNVVPTAVGEIFLGVSLAAEQYKKNNIDHEPESVYVTDEAVP